MFLAEMSNYLKLVCVQGANSKHLLLKLNLRNSGKHLCKSNSLEQSQVNTPRWRSILVNWRDVTHRPCAWSTRKRQLQTLHEVGQLYGRGWRCKERVAASGPDSQLVLVCYRVRGTSTNVSL